MQKNTVFVVSEYLYDGDNSAIVHGTYFKREDALAKAKEVIKTRSNAIHGAYETAPDGLSVGNEDFCSVVKIVEQEIQ